MSPSIDKHLPFLYDLIKLTNKILCAKCANFFLNYSKYKHTTIDPTSHKLFIEYNGQEIAYIKFVIRRHGDGSIRIHLNSFTDKLYQRRRYNLLLRAIITCFGCAVKKSANIKGTFDLFSETADVIILHSILKYFQPRLLYSLPTKQSIDKRRDIILLQTMVDDAHFLKSMGSLEVYVPLDAENGVYADLLLKNLLSSNSTMGIIYPESIIAMDG